MYDNKLSTLLDIKLAASFNWARYLRTCSIRFTQHQKMRHLQVGPYES